MRQLKLKGWLLAVAAMLLMPLGAEAAGLGRMNVLSYLGQPLNAEIELVSVQRNETVNARIGLPDAYAQANLTYNSALAGARITSQQRPNGDLYLRVTTSRPVTEPFIELLVELNTQHGRVTRQYTALLDPAGYGRAAAELPPPVTSPVAGAPSAGAPSSPAPPAQDTSAVGAPAASPSPAAAPAPAAGRRGRSDRSAPPPSGAAGEYGPIKRGETLGRIARSVKPEGVTLEQTLVGLYRDNPDAFIKKNMNLVRSGKILRVPDATSIAAVAPKEASQEVRLQAADFNSFRGRLADRAGEAREEGSVTSGRIGSRVADRAAPEGARDTVRVSRGEPSGKGKGSPRNAAERVRSLEEEAVAREKALVEANDRIEKLEKTIKDMQKLAELKSPGMAAAQQAAEKGKTAAVPAAKKGEEAAVIAAAPQAAAPAPGSDPSAKGSPSAPAPDAGKGGPAPPAAAPEASKAETQKAAPVAKAKAAPPPPPPDYVEMIMSEPLYMATAAGVLLGLGGLGLWAVRRRRGRDDGDGLVKIAPTLTGGGGSAKGPAKGPTTAATTTDAATGTAAAATVRAKRSEPAPRKAAEPKPVASAAAPSASAAAASTPAAAATTSAAPAAAAPAPADDNDLDFGAKTPGGGRPAARPAAAQPTPSPRPASQAAAPKPMPPPTPSPAPAAQRPAAPPPLPLEERAPDPITPDFELDATPTAKPTQGGERTIDSNIIDFSLDPLPPVGSPDLPTINTMAPTPSGAAAASTSPPDLKFDLNALDLQLGQQQAAPAGPAKDEHWYDVQQKFDLAKAYEEMGDKDGARDILKEVLKEGDAEQQTQAQKLLGPLG